jgi:hypothetical protein
LHTNKKTKLKMHTIEPRIKRVWEV